MKTHERTILCQALLAALLLSCGRGGDGPSQPAAPSADTTPPKVLSTSPANGASNVSVNSAVIVTFSEPLNPETVNGATMSLSTENGPVGGKVTCSGATAVFSPNAQFDAMTIHRLTVSTGLRDLGGNALADQYQTAFMTGASADTTPPRVSGGTPTGTGVSVYTAISAVFSEPMDASTITTATFLVRAAGQSVTGAVTLGTPGTRAVYVLTDPLPYDADVQVTIVSGAAGVKDLAGNGLAADYSWSFRTGPVPPRPVYSLTVTKTGAGDGVITADTGTLAWSGAIGVSSYDAGTTVLLTQQPVTGSLFAGWTGCTSLIGAVCRVDMTAARSVFAAFDRIAYAITASVADAVPHGSIFPSGTVSVNHGDSQTFTMMPDSGYHVDDVLVDDVSAGPTSSFTFSQVTADHRIAARFAINTYTITATAGPNGSISPAGGVALDHGGTVTFTIAPSPGYQIVEVFVDSASQGAVDSYTFTQVSGNHTISAVFGAAVFTITAAAGPNGSITPAGAVPVEGGGSLTLEIAPDFGYHVNDVLVDGESAGALTSYTFSDVGADHEIQASFALNAYIITATSDLNGSIRPAGDVPVDHGDSITFTITPKKDYAVADVLVDGESAGAVSTYVFDTVTGPHTIEAVFAPVPEQNR